MRKMHQAGGARKTVKPLRRREAWCSDRPQQGDFDIDEATPGKIKSGGSGENIDPT